MPSPPLDFGGAATGLAGVAGAAGGFPWAIALPVIFSFLQSTGLFGKTEEQQRQEQMQAQQQNLDEYLRMMQRYMPPAWMSRGMGQAAYNALLGQWGRMANWGYPENMQMDLGWLQPLMDVGLNPPIGQGAGQVKMRA